MNILVCEDLGIAKVIVDRLCSLAESENIPLESTVTESITKARRIFLEYDVLVIDVTEARGRELAAEALQNRKSVLATITGSAIHNDPIITSDILQLIKKPDFPLEAIDFAIGIFYIHWRLRNPYDALSFAE